MSGLLATSSISARPSKTSDSAFILDYFLKTAKVCKLDPDETFALLQKYAKPIHWYSPPALVAKLRNMGMGGAGWRIDFIARIATNFFVQSVIRDHGGCDSYLDWYTSG